MTKGNSHLYKTPFFPKHLKPWWDKERKRKRKREGIRTVIHDNVQDVLTIVALLKKDLVYVLNAPLLCLIFPLVASFLCMTFPLKRCTIDCFAKSNIQILLVLSTDLRLLGRLNISPDTYPLDTFP